MAIKKSLKLKIPRKVEFVQLFMPVLLVNLIGLDWFFRTACYTGQDQLFYIVTARRMAIEGRQSFSGLFDTNGLHPLWLWLVAGWSKILALFSPMVLWKEAYAVPLVVGLVAVAMRNLLHFERNWQLPVGCVALPFVAFTGVLGMLYSEAHLLLVMLSWWALLVTREAALESWFGAFEFGLVHGLLVLARLDTIFLASISFLVLGLRGNRRRYILLAALAGAIPVLAYLLHNMFHFGGFMPVSGYLKSTFPKWVHFWPNYNVPFGLVPLVIAGFLFSCGKRMFGLEGRKRLVTSLLFAGGLLHWFYTSRFATWNGWYWYYLVPLFAGLVAVGLMLSSLRPSLVRATSIAALLGIPVLATYGILMRSYREPADSRAMFAYAHRTGVDGLTVLVSEAPGKLAFHSRANVIAADMLTGNRQLVDKMRYSGNALKILFDVAREAGAPIEVILVPKSDFLEWNNSTQMLTYRDPAQRYAKSIIGRMRLGPPDVIEGNFVGWDLRKNPLPSEPFPPIAEAFGRARPDNLNK